MFALSAARDLAIAIVIAVILGSAIGGLTRRAERQTPTIHADLCATRACLSVPTSAEARR